MENNVLIFIHLMAAAVGTGGAAYCVLLLLPALEKGGRDENPAEDSARFKALDILAPAVFVSVLVLIGTGIVYLMENYTLQVNFKPGYYNLFGAKMVCAAAAFFLGLYQTFGLRSRLADLDLKPENRKLVPATLDKMKKTSKLLLGVMTLTIFLGVCLARF